MQLTCNINKAAAIRRAFIPNPTVTLEVDLSTMTQEERDILASRCVHGGNQEECCTYAGILLKPTIDGLMDDIHRIDVKLTKAREKAKIKQAKAIATIHSHFSDRITHTWPETVSAWTDAEGVIQTQQGYHGDPLTRGEAKYDFWAAGPQQVQPAQLGEWNRLMATPAGLKWIKEIQAENAFNLGYAEKQAIAEHGRKMKAHAESEARNETLRQWAIVNGSELLSLRAEENLDWESLARQEWAVDAVRRAGITTPSLTEMEGYTVETEHVSHPTIEELKALQRVRLAMEAIPEADAEVKLQAFIYTEQDTMYYNVIKRKEISVTIRGHANECRLYFPAE
jgi:hypothetical protein